MYCDDSPTKEDIERERESKNKQHTNRRQRKTK